MKVSDIDPRWQDDFQCFFYTYFHDEEEAASDEYDDDEELDACEVMDDCFAKVGDERMQEIWTEFVNQSPEHRLMICSKYDAVDD